MSIDLNREQLISLAELARNLPRRRRGRPVHASTVHRWRARGVDGIRLECVRIGGAWCTSREAFQRFSDRLTELYDARQHESSLPRPTEPSGIERSPRPAPLKDALDRQLHELEANGW